MAELTKNIAVLGAGNMGAALIGGMLKAAVATPERLVATTRSEAHAREIAERFAIRATAGGNRDAVTNADLVILGVKPSTLPSVLAEIHDCLRPDQIVVSLAASLPITVI
jgi:pyrroline-5-carboxylate reductase